MENTSLIIAGAMVLAIVLLMAMFARLFRKAGPHEALIVYGFRGTRVVKGRGTVIFPMVESCRELSLQLMSFDLIDVTPHKKRHLRVPLHELPCCIVRRSADIGLPVSLIARTSKAGLGPCRTGLRFLGEYSLGLIEIDYRHGVAAFAFRGGIDTCRQIGFMLRFAREPLPIP